MHRIRGFYGVVDRIDDALADALLASATVLQVRCKGATSAELAAVARWARARTAAVGALLVVNDDLAVAEAVGADGVHLGQDDLPLAVARSRTRLAIGISTHDIDQVARAIAGGADYLGFGPIYRTDTKANPDPVRGTLRLAAAVAVSPVPVVAIGGITPTVAAEVAATGVAAACAIAAVNASMDPAAAARAIAAAFAAR